MRDYITDGRRKSKVRAAEGEGENRTGGRMGSDLERNNDIRSEVMKEVE